MKKSKFMDWFDPNKTIERNERKIARKTKIKEKITPFILVFILSGFIGYLFTFSLGFLLLNLMAFALLVFFHLSIKIDQWLVNSVKKDIERR